MDRESDFTDLMARAGSGDPEAIRDFLDRFEQEVRVMVRARLPRKLRPRFDSGDFVQIEVLSLRRQGLTFAEVAERTGIHERSVRRIIELFRSRLEGRP